MSVTVNKSSVFMNKLHDTIGDIIGGVPTDYKVEGIANIITVTILHEIGIDDSVLSAYLSKWGSLTLAATKNIINADGVDQTVVTSNGILNCSGYAWLENVVVGQQLNIVDGQITFKTDVVGTYIIEMRLVNGTSGYIEIGAI